MTVQWKCLLVYRNDQTQKRKKKNCVHNSRKETIQLTTNIRHDTLRYITYCGVRSESSSFSCCSNVEIRPSFLGFIWNVTRPQFSLENSAENCLWVCPKQAVAIVAGCDLEALLHVWWFTHCVRKLLYVFFHGCIVSPSQNSAYRPLFAASQLDRVTAPLTSRNRVCCLVWSCSQ